MVMTDIYIFTDIYGVSISSFFMYFLFYLFFYFLRNFNGIDRYLHIFTSPSPPFLSLFFYSVFRGEDPSTSHYCLSETEKFQMRKKLVKTCFNTIALMFWGKILRVIKFVAYCTIFGECPILFYI